MKKGILLLGVIVVLFMILNSMYKKGMENCTQRYDTDYCKAVLSE